MYAQKPIIGDRKLSYIYFGGGTPSFLSTSQLQTLTDALKARLPWDQAEEITFECEPGTLNNEKLKFIKDLGITRLSLGVENFDSHIPPNPALSSSLQPEQSVFLHLSSAYKWLY